MTKNKHIIVSYDKFDVGILMKDAFENEVSS